MVFSPPGLHPFIHCDLHLSHDFQSSLISEKISEKKFLEFLGGSPRGAPADLRAYGSLNLQTRFQESWTRFLGTIGNPVLGTQSTFSGTQLAENSVPKIWNPVLIL